MKWNMKTRRIFFFFHNVIKESGLILEKKNGNFQELLFPWEISGRQKSLGAGWEQRSNPSEGGISARRVQKSLWL